MMLANFRKKELAIIDSSFPRKEPRAFRNTEINEYLKRIKNVSAYAMYPMRNDGAWFPHGYGINKETFKDNLKGYLKIYPQNKGRIHYLDKKYIKRIGLAYSFFLAETYTLLPFYEKYKIPFVFVLYPGGAFGINYDESDRMLKEIFSSKYFKGVFVTQDITEDYLLEKKLCQKVKIQNTYGGFVQFRKNDIKKKKYYKKDKNTIDICFVANKYSEQGVDKGYDIFIETAKLICKQKKDVYFHVLGNFSEADIDISDISNRVKFHGFMGPDKLPDFYSSMDINLTPNRPGMLWSGNFDGFPLGADSQYCGVAIFTSDELRMNKIYIDMKDIVIVSLNPEDIAKKILHFLNNIEELYLLSKKGQLKAQKRWEIEYQIDKRIQFFSKNIELHLNNGIRNL